MIKKDIVCLVFHHNDLDGKCAGAIVNYFEENCHLYSINYGYDVPWNLVKRAQKIYMVDFGLQPFSDMVKMRDIVGKDNFIWIDHHKTAIQDMEDSGQEFRGIQEIGKAGCELTWEWFQKQKLFHNSEEMPPVVKMLGRYDVWDLSYHQDVMPVQYGMKLYNPDGDASLFWKSFFEDEDGSVYKLMVEKGRTCHDYQTQLYGNYCNAHSFDIEFEGLRFLAANALHVSSQLFEAKWNHQDYDAMLCFGFTNGNWSVSMYTDKDGIDVGAIAKKHGGGGHVGASGFQCYDGLPFDLPTKKG
jgi:oligoribonuclease NrnB/cAMP/cGMP phosphodiesterase (DHH superfamily)